MKVPLLNFVGDPGVPLLNFEVDPRVPHLHFRGVPGLGSQSLEVPGLGVLVPHLHHAHIFRTPFLKNTIGRLLLK